MSTGTTLFEIGNVHSVGRQVADPNRALGVPQRPQRTLAVTRQGPQRKGNHATRLGDDPHAHAGDFPRANALVRKSTGMHADRRTNVLGVVDALAFGVGTSGCEQGSAIHAAALARPQTVALQPTGVPPKPVARAGHRAALSMRGGTNETAFRGRDHRQSIGPSSIESGINPSQHERQGTSSAGLCCPPR